MLHVSSLNNLQKHLNQKKLTESNISLMEDIKSRMQGYGLSSLQSCSTLQKSVQLYSFSKSERFKVPKSRKAYLLQDDIAFINHNSSLTNNGASIGLGEKNYFTFKQKSIMKHNPAPNAYNVDWRKNGNQMKSFGAHYEVYKKAEKQEDYPGPGKYYEYKNFGKDGVKASLKGNKNLQIKDNRMPSPQDYLIKDEILQNQRYKNIQYYNKTRTLI